LAGDRPRRGAAPSGDMQPGATRLVLFAGLLFFGSVLARLVFGYWRLRQMSPAEGAMVLQETGWDETRREPSRVEWWRARARRRGPPTEGGGGGPGRTVAAGRGRGPGPAGAAAGRPAGRPDPAGERHARSAGGRPGPAGRRGPPGVTPRCHAGSTPGSGPSSS